MIVNPKSQKSYTFKNGYEKKKTCNTILLPLVFINKNKKYTH